MLLLHSPPGCLQLPLGATALPTPGSYLDFRVLSGRGSANSYFLRHLQRQFLFPVLLSAISTGAAGWEHEILELHPKLQNVQEFLADLVKTATELQFYVRDTQPTSERDILTKYQPAAFPLKPAKPIPHKIPWILEYSLNILPSGSLQSRKS